MRIAIHLHTLTHSLLTFFSSGRNLLHQVPGERRRSDSAEHHPRAQGQPGRVSGKEGNAKTNNPMHCENKFCSHSIYMFLILFILNLLFFPLTNLLSTPTPFCTHRRASLGHALSAYADLLVHRVVEFDTLPPNFMEMVRE